MIQGAVRGIRRWLENLNRPLLIWWRCIECGTLVFENDRSRSGHLGHKKRRWARLTLTERFLIRWGLMKELYE
jgi:hypothetical protein